METAGRDRYSGHRVEDRSGEGRSLETPPHSGQEPWPAFFCWDPRIVLETGAESGSGLPPSGHQRRQSVGTHQHQPRPRDRIVDCSPDPDVSCCHLTGLMTGRHCSLLASVSPEHSCKPPLANIVASKDVSRCPGQCPVFRSNEIFTPPSLAQSTTDTATRYSTLWICFHCFPCSEFEDSIIGVGFNYKYKQIQKIFELTIYFIHNIKIQHLSVMMGWR